jgi:uncharacterized protein YjbI with pentapeptide repeats
LRIQRSAAALLAVCAAVAALTTVHAQIPGRNVNMVSGTTLPDGDPYLQRQNEPSIAASTRNPLHLLGGANDYRTVDIPGLPDGIETGDAWTGLFKSTDGGQRWKSTLIPGYPQDATPIGLASPIKGYQAAADPVVRAGTNGLFYYAGLAFDRGDNGKSAIFLSRFVDNNNLEGGDPIAYLGTRIVAKNPGARFLDKPWLAVDIPRTISTCTIAAPNGQTQRVPAGPAYVTWSAITGSGASIRSQIFLSRSLDCGATWSAPIQISRAQDQINQGSTIAIDPKSGTVFVAWRRFAVPGSDDNDAILVARSLDLGKKFECWEAHRFPRRGRAPKLPPWVFEHRGKDKDRDEDEDGEFWERGRRVKFKKPRQVDEVAPFDQGTQGDRFRTNGYPAMTVDGNGRVYVAWTERGYSTVPTRGSAVDGDAKIVMSTSSTGIGWTNPRAVSEVDEPGHQFMPSLTFAGGRLLLVYYDLRDDVSQTFSQFADDTSARPSGRRRTMDIRASLGAPGSAPQFAGSVKVSDYPFGSRHGSLNLEQLQFNPPNLPMFALGSVPFVGDYIDITPAPPFLSDGRGGWDYNTQGGSTLPIFHAVWTDNRDVRPPLNGDWTRYSPPRSAFNPLAICDPGFVASRNQNVYTARITGGLLAGSPGNSKPLSPTLQRTFVVYAQNTSSVQKAFRMTILAQPPGGRASFSQFSAQPLVTIDLATAPRSLAARTIYATSTSPKAQIQVDVREIAAIGGAIVPQGLQAQVVLNPDISNPDISNPDISNPNPANPDISNAEVHNPDISNPDISNPDISNPDISNPDISNPDISNSDINNPDISNPDISNVVVLNPDISNPDISNPDISNPDISNPDISNPDISNPDISNGALTDLTWTMQNNGNTTTAYNVNLFLANQNVPGGIKYQLVLHKLYTTPFALDCDLKLQRQTVLVANIPNPQFATAQSGFIDANDPSVTNPSLWLSPGEGGRITLRLIDPDRSNNVIVNGASIDPAFIPALNTITPIVIPQPVGTPDIILGETKPPIVTPTNTTVLFLQQPTNVVSSLPIAPTVALQVRNTFGAVVQGVTVTLSFGSNPGGAVLSGASAVTDGNGIASFPFLAIDKVGTPYTLVASVAAPGFVPATSSPFEVTGIVVSVPATAGGLDNDNFELGPANTGGTVPVNTGVFVAAGQSVTLAPAGGVQNGGVPATPAGINPGFPNSLVPLLNTMALVARFGPTNPWQFVGLGPTTFVAPISGFLELAVNDNDYHDNTGAFSVSIAPPPAPAAFVVTNTQDAGAGSLRAAIEAANAAVGPQGIAFKIPGIGPFTIAPLKPLPPLTNAIVIDATTQPGYAGVPLVNLSGASLPIDSNGLVTTAAGSTIRGLALHSFRTGNLAGGNLVVLNGPFSIVSGNYLGVDSSGTSPLPSNNGVVGNSSGNVVGGGAGLTIRNVITGLSGAGVVMPAGARTRVDRNSIDGNGGLGIDGGAAGVTPNDPFDANGVQNFPLITSAANVVPGFTTINVALSSVPTFPYRIQLFRSPSCDPSGYGEGAVFLTQMFVTAGADGNAAASVNVPVLPVGTVLTATAIGPDGGTSEFSPCASVVLTLPSLTVVGPVGGNGGSPFGPISCPAGTAATALKGKAGDDVEYLELWCGAAGESGIGVPGLAGAITFAGGTTPNAGTDFGAALTCEPNSVITGIFGFAAPALGPGTTNIIDMLGVHCTNLTTHEDDALGPVGVQNIRTTATGTFLKSCPAGTRVVGIQGRKGNVLDAIAIVCQ